jgi:hypothetical protein
MASAEPFGPRIDVREAVERDRVGLLDLVFDPAPGEWSYPPPRARGWCAMLWPACWVRM